MRPTKNQLSALLLLKKGNWPAYDTLHVATRRSMVRHGWVEADACGCPVLSDAGNTALETELKALDFNR